MQWERLGRERNRHVHLAVIDTPFVYGGIADHAVDYVRRQIEGAIEAAERVAGRSLDLGALREATRLSKEAADLWMQILDRGRKRPAPLGAIDQFVHMAPIVEMRGDPVAVGYCRGLLAEVDERVARGVGAVRRERKRVVWDGLPIWYRLKWLSDLTARNGVSLVASTYTRAWADQAALMDPDRPIESAARVYLSPLLNLGAGEKLARLQKVVEAFSADGVVLLSDRSCKPYSVGQLDAQVRVTEEMGVPALLLESDHSDPRAFSEAQSTTRLEAFFEQMDHSGPAARASAAAEEAS